MCEQLSKAFSLPVQPSRSISEGPVPRPKRAYENDCAPIKKKQTDKYFVVNFADVIDTTMTESACMSTSTFIYMLEKGNVIIYTQSKLKWCCKYCYSPKDVYPSCLQTTRASRLSQLLPHTVPHTLSMQISTLPSRRLDRLPAKRSWPSLQFAGAEIHSIILITYKR